MVLTTKIADAIPVEENSVGSLGEGVFRTESGEQGRTGQCSPLIQTPAIWSNYATYAANRFGTRNECTSFEGFAQAKPLNNHGAAG